MKEEREKNMSEKIVVCLEKGGARDMAEAFSRRTNTPISEKPGRKAIDATAGMVKLTEVQPDQQKTAAHPEAGAPMLPRNRPLRRRYQRRTG